MKSARQPFSRLNRHRSARLAAFLVAMGAASSVHAYNSNPQICLDDKGNPTKITKAPQGKSTCDIASHAVVSHFAIQLAMTHSPSPGFHAWLKKLQHPFGDPGLASFHAGANAPDTLDTALDTVPYEIEVSFPSAKFSGSVFGPKSKVLSVDVLKQLNEYTSVDYWVKRLHASMDDGQAKAFLNQVIYGKGVWIKKLEAHMYPPLHFSALAHFVKDGKGVGLAFLADPSSPVDDLQRKVNAVVDSACSFWDKEYAQSRALNEKYAKEALLGHKSPNVIAHLSVVKTKQALKDAVRSFVQGAGNAAVKAIRGQVSNLLKTVAVRRYRHTGKFGPLQQGSKGETFGTVQFDSASQAADGWYKQALSLSSKDSNRASNEAPIIALGHAAHYLQDSSLPHHAWGVLHRGHGEYEDRSGEMLGELYLQSKGRAQGIPKGVHDAFIAARKLLGPAMDRDPKGNQAAQMVSDGQTPMGAFIEGKLWPVVTSHHGTFKPGGDAVDNPAKVGGTDVSNPAKNFDRDLGAAAAATAWLLESFYNEIGQRRKTKEQWEAEHGKGGAAVACGAPTPLKLFWSGKRQDNFVTANTAGFSDALGAGYDLVRTEGRLLTTQCPGTIPLKTYWGRGRDNMATATAEGEGAAKHAGYSFVRIEGYVYEKQEPNTIPLKLYWNEARGDNMTLTSAAAEADAKAAGYTFVRVEGYVLPP